MIEILGLQMQPGYLLAASAATGVAYAVYRIAKSHRELKKEREKAKTRVEPTIDERAYSAADQLRREASRREVEDARLAQRVRLAAEQDRDVRKARTEATRASGTGRRSTDVREPGDAVPLSCPLHPSNTVNSAVYDDAPSRSSGDRSHSGSDDGGSYGSSGDSGGSSD